MVRMKPFPAESKVLGSRRPDPWDRALQSTQGISLAFLSADCFECRRSHSPIDPFANAPSQRHWFADQGLGPLGESISSDRAIGRARWLSLRSTLQTLLERPRDARSLSALNAVLQLGTSTLSIDASGRVVHSIEIPPHEFPMWVVARDFVWLRETVLQRIRRCAHRPCSCYFIDRTKNGQQRWCSMEGCGSRVKSRRYYLRTRRRKRSR